MLPFASGRPGEDLTINAELITFSLFGETKPIVGPLGRAFHVQRGKRKPHDRSKISKGAGRVSLHLGPGNPPGAAKTMWATRAKMVLPVHRMRLS